MIETCSLPDATRPPCERGAAAVEYALLATGVAVAIVLAVLLFGGEVAELFDGACPVSTGSC